MQSVPGLSPLARRLYGNYDDLEQRLAFGSDAVFFSQQLTARYLASSAWAPLADLIDRIVTDKIPTLIYGDYDVDGSSSVFLLFRWLRSQGAHGNWFLPSRFSTGYGLDAGNLRKAIAHGYKALIALDCGTTSIDEIALCREAGMQVAVIDHHTPKAVLPDALLFNPHTDPELPMLCTAGLVYGALAALSADSRWPEVQQGDEVHAAGLATLADVAPLNAYGWAMAHHALLGLPATPNLGLSELLKVARLHGLDRITSRQVGFDLAPRLNAAGRMQHARWVPELLLASDSAKARELAMHIDRLNEERKDAARLVTEQALRQALGFPDSAALVLADQQWHPGVLGIVAARVAEQLGKPVIVLGDAPSEHQGAADPAETAADRLLSGSVRSAAGIDLMPCLEAASSVLESFGGHSAAAGVKVRMSRLEELRRCWSDSMTATSATPAASTGSSGPAGEVPQVQLAELTAAFEADVWSLAPAGPDFPAPRMLLRGLSVARCSYMGAQKTHLNLVLTDGRAELRIAAFGMSHLARRLQPGTQVDVICDCEADNWNNRLGLALRLVEVLD